MRRLLLGVLAATMLLGTACAQGEGAPAAEGGETSTTSAETESPTASEAGEPVRIGAAISESGTFAVDASSLKNGYDLWAKVVNETGGIDVGGVRRPVEIVYADDQSSPEAAGQLTERLATEDGVDFIFGPYGSGLTMATSAIAERHGVINMGAGQALEEIFNRGFNFVFGLTTPASQYFGTTLDALADQGAGTVGFVYLDDAGYVAAAEGAREHAEGLGMEVVAFETVPKDADMASSMQRVAHAGPDVFIGIGGFEANLRFVRTAEQIGFRPDHFALVNGADPKVIDELKASVEGVLAPTQWDRSLDFSGPVFGSAEEYAQLYEDTYGDEPSYVAASGSANAVVLQLAIEAAGTTDTDAVREALLNLDTETFFGPVRFDERGQNVAKLMPATQVQDGKGVVVEPLPAAATWELITYSEVAGE